MKPIELDGYFENDDTMDALACRYEPPDDKWWWENPLYKVKMTKVLPWSKDGTLKLPTESNVNAKVENTQSDIFEEMSSEEAKLVDGKLTNQMKAVLIEGSLSPCSQSGPVNPVSLKPVRKSASGFKQNKKSTQQRPTPQSQPILSNGKPNPKIIPSEASTGNISVVSDSANLAMDNEKRTFIFKALFKPCLSQ